MNTNCQAHLRRPSAHSDKRDLRSGEERNVDVWETTVQSRGHVRTFQTKMHPREEKESSTPMAMMLPKVSGSVSTGVFCSCAFTASSSSIIEIIRGWSYLRLRVEKSPPAPAAAGKQPGDAGRRRHSSSCESLLCTSCALPVVLVNSKSSDSLLNKDRMLAKNLSKTHGARRRRFFELCPANYNLMGVATSRIVCHHVRRMLSCRVSSSCDTQT
eukprot:SAG11_NODE_192_length_12931_cov_5.747682_12_plen_214_part_00